jgi:putative Holliday junction resolvase
MRILAVDFGTKRMGVAVGDTETRVVTPLPPFPFRSHRQSLAEIVRLADEFAAQRVVVGLPLRMDGTPSSTTARVDHFISFLRRRLDMPVAAVDERLSSFAAEQRAAERQPDFRKRKRYLDSLAAQLILEAYLENPQ